VWGCVLANHYSNFKTRVDKKKQYKNGLKNKDETGNQYAGISILFACHFMSGFSLEKKTEFKDDKK